MALFSLPLQLPHSTQYTKLGVPPESSAEALRAAAAGYDARLKARGASEDELVEAHAIRLESPESRTEHDARRPPLELMRLERTWAPLFDDRATGLVVLRREVEAFLVDRGAEVFHPSDTTRRDFSADFTPVPLLDEFMTE